MKLKRKQRLIVLALLLFLVFLLMALLLYKINDSNNRSGKLPEQPLNIDTFGQSNLPVEISSEIDESKQYAPIYKVESKYYKESINEMIQALALSLEESDISDENYIEWEGRGNKFTYNALSNFLTFELSEPIYLGSGEEAFNQIFLEYFDRDYQFNIVDREVVDKDLTNYYARRVVSEIPIEQGYGYEHTDILKFDSKGNVIAGTLLLTEVSKEETSVPIVSGKELAKYINVDVYPKESYVYASQLIDLVDISYLDSRWEEIHSSASNCKSSDIELIYLFKSISQEFLYPSFKILANCDVEFEGENYTVPAIFYVNAVDPEFISIE